VSVQVVSDNLYGPSLPLTLNCIKIVLNLGSIGFNQLYPLSIGKTVPFTQFYPNG